MAKLWAIAIGINQYQYFQPLGYGSADAEVLRGFLVEQAGFPEEQCLLMTDSSVPIGDKPTLPTKNNILQLLEDLAANSWEPQDKLWFFFSGYGINHEGQDYLIPIEGDSQRVKETGIEIRQLMQTLQVCGLEVLLLMDFNRAFGTKADSSIGQETIELAQELQISTILSCQPEQFSHESSELGHGFFTATLLEALRYGNTNNLAGLESYLSVRTPELCQHHWRPTQNPITFIASPQQTLFKQEFEQEQVKSNTEEPLSFLGPRETFTARSAPKLEEKPVNNPLNNNDDSSQVRPVVTKNPPISIVSPEIAEQLEKEKVSSVPNTSPIPTNEAETEDKVENQNTGNTTNNFLLFGCVGSLIVGGLLLVAFLYQQSRSQIKLTVVKPLPSNYERLEKQQPSKPQVNNSNSQETIQAMLELEKMSLDANQASDLSKAIADAKNTQRDEADYKLARKNIQVWSGMILDLAKNRAENMEYFDAIQAAEFITKEEPNYQEAQKAIKQWEIESKKYLSNKTLVEAAQALIQPSQASTYNRAIEVAKRVPKSEPGYNIAQQSINRWSLEILQLAKNRANNKQYSSAIATATLAPEDTAAYAEAQQLIKQWQQQVQDN
ncbi:peptidase C14 caspase catalytic subunit p20 [Calothrix parasitica NIES-267]|uniref:Peptidase C14 caspase catalytic subunit p20 n=1 Tax=Calothrix parasitica NIES-267 TaxID=1973488 RepID=A0A1Z4M0X1_9CYAN|nr:peptidase C14 caspase catalytic subunit p20 [Calothrix parasitica NIES-267]